MSRQGSKTFARNTAFQRGTYVPGSSIVLNRNDETNHIEPVIAATTMKNAGHGDVSYVKKGQPMWRKPKPTGFEQHFRTEAARRAATARASHDLGIPADALTRTQVLKSASPKELKIIPLYRGFDLQLARSIIFTRDRVKRLKAEREAGMSLVERAKAALGLGAGDGTQYA